MGSCQSQNADVQQLESKSDAKFVVITDVHFDPFPGIDDIPHLAQLPMDEWPGYLAGKCGPPTPPGSKKDSNFALLEMALDRVKSTEPDPDFVIFTGDFLCHNIWDMAKTAKLDGDESNAFLTKTAKFVLSR